MGDPDQSIYAFRGADVGGILRFPEQFRVAGTREPAPVVELRTCRRSGPVLLAASRAVASRLPAGSLGPAFRDLRADPAVVPGPGSVQVLLASSPTAEAALVADVLRRAHLVDGVAWSEMAVLVRSTTRALAVLRRALVSAGVPVGVAPEEVPLAEEPLVRALLAVLELGLRPERLDEQSALALLSGPLVRADALEVRRLRRGLRALDTEGTPSDALLVQAVRDPRAGLGLEAPVRRPLVVLDRLLGAVRAADAGDGTRGSAEDVLWAVWQAMRLSCRRSTAAAWPAARRGPRRPGAGRRARAVHRGGALSDRSRGQRARPARDWVANCRSPGDRRSPARGDGEGSRSSPRTPARAWSGSWCAWPACRTVSGRTCGSAARCWARTCWSICSATVPGCQRPLHAERLTDERRLFYVAITRARRALLVTAVDSDEGQPCGSVEELDPLPDTVEARPVATAGPAGSCCPGLVAELRGVLVDPDALRGRAGRRRRAAGQAGGDQVVPCRAAAHPRALVGTGGAVQRRSDPVPRSWARCRSGRSKCRGLRPTASCGRC